MIERPSQVSPADEKLLREKAQPSDNRSIPLTGRNRGERSYLAEISTGESVVYTMIGRRVRVDEVHPRAYLHGKKEGTNGARVPGASVTELPAAPARAGRR